MQGDRIEWLDFMKGIAIIIVVMGHISSTLVGTHAFSDLILVFEMPLFFTLSGILATRTLQRPFCINLKKKCRSLLLPFYTTGFAFALTNERVYEFLTEKYHCGYWFLLSLFFCWLVLLSLSKVVDRFTKKGFKKYAEVVLLITPYFLYHSISHLIPAEMLNVMTIDLTFLFYLFFIIGYYIGKFRNLYIIPQKLGGAILFVVLLEFLLALRQPQLFYVIPRTISQIIFSAGLIYVLYIYYLNTIGLIQHFLCWIGRYSLHIYVSHFFLLSIIDMAFLKDFPELWVFMICLGTSIMVCVTCIFIMFPIENNEMLRKCILGRKK